MSKKEQTFTIPAAWSNTDEIDKRGVWQARIFKRFEPRTCRADYSQALSFEVHDPMWMLSRQWQFGRFRANDCGTLINACVQLQRQAVDGICHGQDVSTRKAISPSDPVEPVVESVSAKLTFSVRVESAVHLRKMIRSRFDADKAARLLEMLLHQYKIDVATMRDEENPITDIIDSVNENRTRFLTVYGGRCFDGVRVYEDTGFAAKVKAVLSKQEANSLWNDFRDWFNGMYQPENGRDSYWNPEKLGYEFMLTSGSRGYVAENYSTGHVGWYSFDRVASKGKDVITEKKFSFIPTIATFPAAPARRLWEYEDRRTHFGNLTNKDVSQLASAVMMEYVSLYSNDWMVIPMYIKPGMITDIKEITVTDTFGQTRVIRRTPQEHDNNPDDLPFSDRWSLFSISKADAYKNDDFSTERGLFFPSSLLRVEESEPTEEVQFLRDEMANMLWGVENKIDDGCGGYMSGDTLSSKVFAVIDAQRGEAVQGEERAEFSFLIQNRVPIHWIPFIPQQITGGFRQIRFRRGRMRLYYKDGYHSVRPNTSTLAVRREGDKIKPLYVNEEEILSYGTKVTLTTQRTRWTGGKSYLWRGYAKKISGYQGNSGLMFDELRKIDKPKPREEGAEKS